jgi:hypothetical protein
MRALKRLSATQQKGLCAVPPLQESEAGFLSIEFANLSSEQGCQIFRGRIINQMAIKYTNIFH